MENSKALPKTQPGFDANFGDADTTLDIDARARNKKVGSEQSNGEDALVDSEGNVSGYEKIESSATDENSEKNS